MIPPEPPPDHVDLDPVDWPATRAQAHRMLDDVLDYLERVRERPVWRPIPEEVRAGLREPSPRDPTDLAEVHRQFLRLILPYATGNVHPGFMGWVHGGGSVAGALAILAPELAPRLEGIQRADSLAVDFHKWGQVPYDAGFIMVRDGALQQRTFASPATYLGREARGLAAGSPWPCDFGPDLSRGFRALKTWFTLKVYGTAHLGANIAYTCRLAQYLKARVEACPELELMAPVTLNIVCFRLRGADPDALNRRIVTELQEAGAVAPSTTVLGGSRVIRAAIVNHRTQPRDIDALVEAVRARNPVC